MIHQDNLMLGFLLILLFTLPLFYVSRSKHTPRSQWASIVSCFILVYVFPFVAGYAFADLADSLFLILKRILPSEPTGSSNGGQLIVTIMAVLGSLPGLRVARILIQTQARHDNKGALSIKVGSSATG